MALDDHQARARVERVGTLLEQVESLRDPTARAMALELAQLCTELYGEGLARVLRHASQHDAGTLGEALAGDELVSHLLLVHGLHPLDPPARLRRVLEALQPDLRRHHASVELLEVTGTTARLRLRAGAGQAARSAVEEAVAEAAPEIEHLEIEEAGPEPAVIPVESLFRTPAGTPGAPR